MAIDIVVVNYKTPADLRQFLESLAANRPTVPATLTVVDVEAAAYEGGLTGPGIPARWLVTADNIGYARACNMGASAGEHDVIALFNADVEVTAGSIDRCHDALLAEDDWAVLGPRQVDRAGRLRHAGIFGTLAHPSHRGWAEPDVGQYVDVREAVTVSGSAYFCKRAVWGQLTSCPLYQDMAPGAQGAFLPTAHYYEETFCSYHAQSHGHIVVYLGSVTMTHKWHRASPLNGWADQQVAASRAYFRAACDHHGIEHD